MSEASGLRQVCKHGNLVFFCSECEKEDLDQMYANLRDAGRKQRIKDAQRAMDAILGHPFYISSNRGIGMPQ